MKCSFLKDLELKEFIVDILKSLLSNESCEVKIPNGAHSTIGKIITKLCSQANQEALHHQRSNPTASAKSPIIESNDDPKSDSSYNEMQTKDEADSNNDYDKLLPLEKPFKREYILRSSVSRPAPYSRQSPQRLYCLISNIEYRLAAAFTEDTMFF